MLKGYEVRFGSKEDPDDLRNLHRMARLSMEALLGRNRVRLGCRSSIQPDGRTFFLNTDTQEGRDFAVIFIGTARRILGEDCCRVIPTDNV